jgi:diguanylate cyclase (GGDEF)-like protein
MRILVAETDPGMRKSLSDKLDEWGYQVSGAEDGEQALSQLRQQSPPRLVLMGSVTKGMTAKRLCREIREIGERPYVYIVMLAAKGQSQYIMEGMEAGSDDYLTTPFDELELKARLRAGKRILDLREELHRAQATIGYQAYHDPLTGLWNRGAILDALNRELARVKREKTPVGLILCTINELKGINDRFGHMAGDAAIRATARELRSSMRPYDALGRYSGESFLIILTGCDSVNSVKQAERFQGILKGQAVDVSQWGKFVSGKDAMLPVNHSFGVVSGTGDNDAEPLLHALEAADHKARSGGPSRIESAPTPPRAAAKAKP